MTVIDNFRARDWSEAGRPLLRIRLLRTLRRAASTFAKVVGLVMLLGVGLTVASHVVAERMPPSPPPAPPSDAWLEIKRPIPIFTLTGTDFARLPLDYRASRNAVAGRRDTLTFGDIHGDGAWLILSLYRVGTQPPPNGELAQDLDDLGEEEGLDLSRIGHASLLPTRFGPFEAADLRIGPKSGSTPCLGFREGVASGAALRILGFLCSTAERPTGRDLLGCIIDRIDLLAAGEDQILRRLFVEAERRRGTACQPSSLTQAGSRTTWLDANGSAPPLRDLTSVPTRHW